MSTPPSAPALRATTLTPEALPEGAELVMRVTPLPADTNVNGDIFGGWIMTQMDLAGWIQSNMVARGRVATVAVDRFVFKTPVLVGDLLSFYAKVERIGRTSVTVHVEAWAQRDPAQPQLIKVTQASLTYVAIDDLGKPRAIAHP